MSYDSRGLGLMPPEKLAAEAEALLRKGMSAIKLRLGYPTLSEDLAGKWAALKVTDAMPFRLILRPVEGGG